MKLLLRPRKKQLSLSSKHSYLNRLNKVGLFIIKMGIVMGMRTYVLYRRGECKVKTALYSRVSTGLQVSDGTSLDVQVDLCLKKALELEIPSNEVIIYREEGVSGEELERPELNKLRIEVAAGRVSRVIVTHPDRLSRDLTDKLYICRELEIQNVKLIFVDTEYQQTAEGMLFFNLMSVIAQYELSLIKKRTIRGRLRAVEKDKKIMPMRSAPFGYNLVDQKLVINEAEAEIVRKIYEWYAVENLTLRQIGERLVSMGVAPKRGESMDWNASSIVRILTSEIYIGKYYYNRRKSKRLKGQRTKTGTPKKTYNYRDTSEWLLVEIPPIVPLAMFELAQQQKIKNKTVGGNVKYEYLLKSKLKCACCGRTWDCTTYSGRADKVTGAKVKYTCYRCPNQNPRRYGAEVVKCPSKTIRTELLDGYVWSLVMGVLSNPEEYYEQINENSGTILEDISGAADLLEKELSKKDKEIDKIKTLFRHGIIDEEEMLVEFKKVNQDKQLLEAEIRLYREQISKFNKDQISAQKMTEMRSTIDQFINSGGNSLTVDEKRHVLDLLIDSVIVNYQNENITLTVLGFLGDCSEHSGVILQKKLRVDKMGPRNEKILVEVKDI